MIKDKEKDKNKETERVAAEDGGYGYYSKLLGKSYDTLGELREAEEGYRKANEEKLRLADERKSRAKEVEDSYAKVMEAKRAANEGIRKAEAEYRKLLSAFVRDYGSYHMTYSNNNLPSSLSGDSWADLVDSFFRFW